MITYDNLLFNTEVENQKNKIDIISKMIDNLPVDYYHKTLYMRLSGSRGIGNFFDFKDELISIYANTNDIIQILLEGKKVGIETIYIIATKLDKQKQVVIFENIKKYGVKDKSVQLMLHGLDSCRQLTFDF